MAAEGNATEALEAINKLAALTHLLQLTIKVPGQWPICPDPDLAHMESELTKSVNELCQQRRIFDEPTLEELMNPIEENSDEDSPYWFEGGDADIVAQVHQEMAGNEMIEINSDNENDDKNEEDQLIRAEVIALCAKLEKTLIQYGEENFSIFLKNFVSSEQSYRGNSSKIQNKSGLRISSRQMNRIDTVVY